MLFKMSAQNPVDYYAVLGVSANSTDTEIRRAFFQLSLSAHPDRRDKSEFEEAHKEYVLISSAYNVLKDKESREKYDASRAGKTQPPTSAQRDHGYEAPRHGNKDFASTNKEAWLHFIAVKDKIKSLSLSLPRALTRVHELVNIVENVDPVNLKYQAASARRHLSSIDTSFFIIRTDVDSTHSPIWLKEATVSRVKNMVSLKEYLQDLVNDLPLDKSVPSEEEALVTMKHLLETLSKFARILE